LLQHTCMQEHLRGCAHPCKESGIRAGGLAHQEAAEAREQADGHEALEVRPHPEEAVVELVAPGLAKERIQCMRGYWISCTIARAGTRWLRGAVCETHEEAPNSAHPSHGGLLDFMHDHARARCLKWRNTLGARRGTGCIASSALGAIGFHAQARTRGMAKGRNARFARRGTGFSASSAKGAIEFHARTRACAVAEGRNVRGTRRGTRRGTGFSASSAWGAIGFHAR
jgi:hypothetical protein